MASDEKIAWAVDEVDRLLDERIPTVTREALAQAAAWEARAEGLESELKRLMGKAIPGRSPGLHPQTVGMDGTYYRIIVDTESWEELHQSLSAPRPSPSRVLGVVRSLYGFYMAECPELWEDIVDEALEHLTPEERQALGEGDP